jgi:hypothetical protein
MLRRHRPLMQSLQADELCRRDPAGKMRAHAILTWVDVSRTSHHMCGIESHTTACHQCRSQQ